MRVIILKIDECCCKKNSNTESHYHEKVKGERELEVGRVALSNLLGSVGYFYGQSLIAIPPEHEVGIPPCFACISIISIAKIDRVSNRKKFIFEE